MYFWVFNFAVYIFSFLDPQLALQLIKDGEAYTCMTPSPVTGTLVSAPGQCTEPMPPLPPELLQLIKEDLPRR